MGSKEEVENEATGIAVLGGTNPVTSSPWPWLTWERAILNLYP